MTHTLAVVTAGGHLSTGIAECLMFLQGLLNGVRWLTLAFEVIWVVIL